MYQKEDREKIWENDEQQIKNWREQAQKLGYIGVYKKKYFGTNGYFRIDRLYTK